MKKSIFIIIAILSMALTGCSNGLNTNDVTNNVENNVGLHNQENIELPEAVVNNLSTEEGYYDIHSEEKRLSFYLEEGRFVLTAFYEEETPVWLIGDESGNVYSYESGQDKELLISDMSPTYVSKAARWWKCGDKYFVSVGNFLHIFQDDGTKINYIVLNEEERVQSISCTENGTVALALYSEKNYTTNLTEINVDTKELVSKRVLQEYYGMTKGPGDCVMLQDSDGIYSYDMKSGDIAWNIKWSGTTYKAGINGNSMVDFRLTEEGNVKLLTMDWIEGTWNEETLTKISYEDINKTLLVYKTLYASSQLKDLIAQFNKQNDTYYIYLD